MPLFHSVGGLDPLEAADVEKPVGDGLPETLPEWIDHNGLVRIKIKLSGEDLRWDVERTLRIDRVAAEAQARRGVTDWKYCLDFNERCPNVDYVLDCLRQIREGTPARLRAHPLRRAADRARPAREPRATSCTRRRSCGRWSSTSR